MHRNTVTIHVLDLVGIPYCVSSKDGHNLFEKLVPLIEIGKKFHLSFKGIDVIICAFLNVAIGQLFSRFSEEKIVHQLSWSGLTPYDDDLINYVIENAKMFFARKKRNTTRFGMKYLTTNMMNKVPYIKEVMPVLAISSSEVCRRSWGNIRKIRIRGMGCRNRACVIEV